MEIKSLHELFLQTTGVCTDTRKIGANNLFFALKGDNFNGNQYALQAINAGAKYAVIDEEKYKTDDRFILVADVLTTLQELAKFHRNQLNITIIGLTGSNGKTTTKELINCVLSEKYATKATIGNLNNHIGVPLTLLSFDNTTEIGIVEMGANHQKEIEMLCEICLPDFGYITNFGKAHLEGFGGVEGVIKGKSELYNYLKSHQKKVFVNLNDTIQVEKSVKLNCITFAVNNTLAFVNVQEVSANPMVKVVVENTEIQSNLIGIYNANNINAAITMGKHFNVDMPKIKHAIENYVPNNNRSQLIEKNGNQIILDAYNANPSSMQAALTNFFQLNQNNKIAVLGDMFELGEESSIEHKNIIDFCVSQDNITFYFVGKMFFEHLKSKSNENYFESFETFKNNFKLLADQNNLILIKGSRGMSLEKTLDLL